MTHTSTALLAGYQKTDATTYLQMEYYCRLNWFSQLNMGFIILYLISTQLRTYMLNFYMLASTLSVPFSKFRILVWAGHVGSSGETRNAHQILF